MLDDDNRRRADVVIDQIGAKLIRARGVHMADTPFATLPHNQLAMVAARLLERLIEAKRENT